jgi:hypothetical protein
MSEVPDAIEERCMLLERATALLAEALGSPGRRSRMRIRSEFRELLTIAADRQLPESSLRVIQQAERAISTIDWRLQLSQLMFNPSDEASAA